MLLIDLVDELEGHGLSNADNISYFTTQLSLQDKSDQVFYELCHPAVACLLQKLGNKDNRESCIILCKKILNTLADKRYFTLLVDWLAKTIDETTVSDFDSRRRINDITHLVIADYVAEGSVLEELKKYATDIPRVLMVENGDVVSAPSEFETLKKSDYASEVDYFKAVAEYIKNRDVYKCLEVLKYHYYEEPRKAIFIVRLIGLKGQIDDYIGDINIYSPKKKRYITGEISVSKIENVVEERDYVNAAIPIDFVSIERAKVYAKARLEEVLDILMLTYKTVVPVTIATNSYAVVIDGNEVSMSISNSGNDPLMASRDEMMKYLEALDLAEIRKDGFKFMSDKHAIIESGRVALKIRIKNAAHWYTKAVAADKDVDVLLYSWFAIEGLLKVGEKTQAEMLDNTKDAHSFKVIQEFVSSIICKNYFRHYLREIYWDFLYKTNKGNNYYDVTEDVIVKAGLNLKKGDHYRDGDFLNAVPALLDCVNDDIVKDRLSLMQMFYENDNGIKEKARQVRDDLLMIYRLRNMIVHNAALSCVNISFYAHVALNVAKRVIRYVMDHSGGGDKTIDEIILGAKLNYQVFLANYDEELKKLKNGE